MCTSTLVDKFGVVQASSGPCRTAETSQVLKKYLLSKWGKNDLCFVDSFEDLLKLSLGKKDKCTHAQYFV